MIARVRCGKCGETGKFDMGAEVASVEQAQVKLNSVKITSCPFGHHVEFSAIGYTVLEIEAGQAPTDEEWLATMTAERDVWSTDELRATEIEITGFSCGFPMAKIKSTGADFNLDFVTSPEGRRYYFAPRGAYERAVADQPAASGGTI